MQTFGRRLFSSSVRLQKHISHIGANPIPYPPSVTLSPSPTDLQIKGPLGETCVPLRPFISLSFPKGDTALLALSVEDAEIKEQRAMWGTTRTLISNAITGMTEGFSVNLYLVGVGYRANIEQDTRGTMDGNSGNRLNMKVGYSHSVFVPIPPWIKATVPSPTKITLFCTSKQQLGLFAALVRSFRKPEPYKGKGIFIDRETIGIKKVRKK